MCDFEFKSAFGIGAWKPAPKGAARYRVCVHCGAPYTAASRSQRYCCDSCRRAAKKERLALAEAACA